MQIRSILLALLLLITTTAQADVLIGFMGLGNRFDHAAFNDYARHRGLTPIVLHHDQVDRALRIISQKQHYELYGYSLGAGSVKATIKRASILPQRVVTIGAYRTTDVNFTQHGVEFYNYFDNSGRGQRSPGEFLPADHWTVQRKAVTKLLQFND